MELKSAVVLPIPRADNDASVDTLFPDIKSDAATKGMNYDEKLLGIWTDGLTGDASSDIRRDSIFYVDRLASMVITGYGDSKQAIPIMNSWSTAWADGGFAWIAYDFFLANVIEGGYVVI